MNFPLFLLLLVRRAGLVASLLVVTLPSMFANPVIAWNEAMTAHAELQPPPGIPPFVEARAYAMAHLAMRNAVTARGINHGISNEAAVAQAAHDVLVAALPGGAPQFASLRQAQLATIPEGSAKTKGIEIGAAEAASVLKARANDGSANPTGPYTPGTSPGSYRPTPPFNGPPFNGFVDAVNWGKVTPFGLKSGDQFRAPPPYQVTDLGYTFDFIEIKALGSAGSSVRSADQTNLARFWYESSPMGWNRIARILAAQSPLSLVDSAQLFALVNIACADAYIGSIDSKFAYNFWRPITAIHQAVADGNDSTEVDPTWTPLLLTPPIPDYPSAHACAGGAVAAVLISVFGDHRTFTVPSTMSVPFPTVTPRTFHRISDAARENALSRMLVGIHFRLACEVGYEQGVQIGRWIVENHPRIK